MADYANIPLDSRRVPLATKVQFKFDRFSGFISEYSANISPSGMFIVSEKPEPVGRILDLEFRLGDGFEIITGQGEVVWSRSVPDGPSRPPGMGIRFMELSPGSKDLIRRIVDQYVAQGGTPFDLTGMYTAPPVPLPEPDLPPLAQEPDPFELPAPVRESSGSAFPWYSEQKSEPKESGSMSGKALPPLEPLDEEIFKLEDPAPPAPVAPAPAQPVLPFLSAPAAAAPPAPEIPAEDPFPPFVDPLEMTQAGPTVGFEAEEPPVSEPFPPPAALRDSAAPASVSSPGPADTAPLAPPTLGPDDETFAIFLPKQAPPADAAPAVRPLATLAGGASVHQPRRVSPLLLGLLLLVALGAAGFFLRDQIAGWIGLGGGEEVAEAQTPPVRRPEPAPAAPPPTLQEELSLTSDAMASTLEPPAQPGAPAGEPVAEAEPEQPLPEVVRRKPAAPAPAAAAPAGPTATAIERITFEPAPGGTVVVLWGNGAIRAESYRRISLTDPAREVIQVRGMRQPFSPARIQAGTGELRQIRVGYHQKGGDNELHIVLDLGGPRVKVLRVEPDGQRLRIHLQGS